MGKNEHIVCERVNDCTLKLVSMTSYSHLTSDIDKIVNFFMLFYAMVNNLNAQKKRNGFQIRRINLNGLVRSKK